MAGIELQFSRDPIQSSVVFTGFDLLPEQRHFIVGFLKVHIQDIRNALADTVDLAARIVKDSAHIS